MVVIEYRLINDRLHSCLKNCIFEYLIGSLDDTQFGFKFLYSTIFLVDRFTFVTTDYKI